jgi:hypothetical protein
LLHGLSKTRSAMFCLWLAAFEPFQATRAALASKSSLLLDHQSRTC